jgi:hypothetical protein
MKACFFHASTEQTLSDAVQDRSFQNLEKIEQLLKDLFVFT